VIELVKRLLLRTNWRLTVATLGWLLSEYDLGLASPVQRKALSGASFATIVASIASWQNRIGKRVPREPREEPNDKP